MVDSMDSSRQPSEDIEVYDAKQQVAMKAERVTVRKVRRHHQDIPPSDPNFDRSNLTDKEYIELLLFEIKELRAEKGKIKDHPNSEGDDTNYTTVNNTTNLPQPLHLNHPKDVPSFDISDHNEKKETNETHETHETPLNPVEDSTSTETAPLDYGPRQETSSNRAASEEADTSTQDQSIDSFEDPDVSKKEEEIPLRSSRRRRNSAQPDQELSKTVSATSTLSGVAKSGSYRSSLHEQTSTFPDSTSADDTFRKVNTPFDDVINDSFVSVKSDMSRTRSNQSATESHTRAMYSQNKNQSASSFTSYKSRIKLPPALQQQQEKREKEASNESPNSTEETGLKSPVSTEFLDSTSATSTWNSRYDTPTTQSSAQFTNTPDDKDYKGDYKVGDGFKGDLKGVGLTVNDPRTPYTPDGFNKQGSTFNNRDEVLPSSTSVYSNSKTPLVSPSLSKGGSFQVFQTPKEEDDVNLFIKPQDFHTINLVIQSTISLSDSRRPDEPSCTIVVADRESGKEMWRIRKSYTQLVAFDNEIRHIVEFFGLPTLPEKALFLSTSPVKIDQRRTGLQAYFNTLFVMPHIPHMVLYRICRYLSLDFVNPLDDYKSGSKKEGYLIRRYKGLGTSWKVRWCQVDGPSLEIYEVPGGPLVEQIRLRNCQIGRQSNDTVAEDKGYRHAFLVMESQKTKLSNSYPKHFFCAETDEERDQWVEVLLQFNECQVETPSIEGVESPSNRSEYQDELPISINDQLSSYSEELVADQAKKTKKRYFGFRRNDDAPLTVQTAKDDNLNPNQPFYNPANHYAGASTTSINSTPTTPHSASEMQQYLDQLNLDEGVTKSIFGRDVKDSYELSNHPFYNRPVPSICYRCLDFLTKTGAIYEEGIFRLSGSASTIRQLKQQFNTQFDIDLFESPLKPDMHTVAGLFKAYLRELPNPIMGTHAYNHLNQVILHNGKSIAPSQMATIFRDYLNENVEKIRYDFTFVILKFLRQIIAHSANNRMNLRNVCIVFVPTLNISLEVLSVLLVDFECIFEGGRPLDDDKREVLDLHIPTF